MLIAILFCLLTDSTVDGETVKGELYRVERLQGQCSAWCYETYGSWAPARQHLGQVSEQVYVYQCRPGLDQDCWDCDIGCSLEFHSLAQCYRRCNEKPVCKEACKHHRDISRLQIDMEELEKNLTTFNNPHYIYEESEQRNNSAISLWWNHVNMFSDQTAVVYMVFLLNYTTDSPEEKPEALYIGHTPHYVFPARPLSPDYCYQVRILSVTSRNGIAGTCTSTAKYVTDAEIHVTNITTTSADIWFKTRLCEPKVNYGVRLVWDLSDSYGNFFIIVSNYSSQDGRDIFTAHAPDLTPNKEYRVLVDRQPAVGNNDMFGFYGEFTTLPAPPDTNVTVTSAVVSYDTIAYEYKIEDFSKLYAEESDIKNYVLKIRDADRGGWEEITIPGSRQDGLYKVQNLTPHVRYCATMAVRNPTGLGPFSEELCNTTTSAPAPAPELRLVETLAEEVTIEVTRPEPPKGNLVTYNVTYTDNTVRKNLDYIVKSGLKQNITMKRLNSHTPYTFIVRAVNSQGMIGAPKEIQVTTLQSIPEAAPLLSTCDITPTNSTHFNATISWVGVHEDKVNGEIANYTLHLQKVISTRGENLQEVVYDKEFSFSFGSNKTRESIAQPLGSEFDFKHKKNELVRARLSISTEIGQGPWPTEYFNCSVPSPGRMGPGALEILLPVLSVIAIFIGVVAAFFYFFRFKTYKKTPYEEIKKLIKPETFSPCQHCMHNKEPKRWDVFICHVSEDENYIIQLKEAFVREKIDVFFAKDELSWGCELHRVINDGLRDSKYGLVVLSKHFVNKCSKWTSSELSSLHSKSRLSSQDDCILPIWKKDISEAEVGAFDMTLVGIKALKEEDMSVDQMAVELKKKLRSSGTCWGCKSYEYGWSTSDCSLDASPVDSLHTTLL
ncbi:hypothetical protein ACHWQZ_G019122 [Mnemiopsis leidyi]